MKLYEKLTKDGVKIDSFARTEMDGKTLEFYNYYTKQIYPEWVTLFVTIEHFNVFKYSMHYLTSDLGKFVEVFCDAIL